MVFFGVGTEVRSKAPQSQVVQADALCFLNYVSDCLCLFNTYQDLCRTGNDDRKEVTSSLQPKYTVNSQAKMH